MSCQRWQAATALSREIRISSAPFNSQCDVAYALACVLLAVFAWPGVVLTFLLHFFCSASSWLNCALLLCFIEEGSLQQRMDCKDARSW